MGTVDASKGDGPGVEITEDVFDVVSNNIPELNVERRAKAIQPAAGKLVHIQEGVYNFRGGERG